MVTIVKLHLSLVNEGAGVEQTARLAGKIVHDGLIHGTRSERNTRLLTET